MTNCWACGRPRFDFTPHDAKKPAPANYCECHHNAALVTLHKEITALPMVGRVGDHATVRLVDVLNLIHRRIVKHD